MPTTILDNESYPEALQRRYEEEAKNEKNMKLIQMAGEACAPHQILNTDLVFLERFAALVAAHEREKRTKELMQLFLDPENQPTQFGTVTLEMYEALENSLMQAALQIEAWQGRCYAKEGELENIKIDLMALWNNRSNDINTTVANLLIKNGMGDV